LSHSLKAAVNRDLPEPAVPMMNAKGKGFVSVIFVTAFEVKNLSLTPEFVARKN
jgi:hypothetical protein